MSEQTMGEQTMSEQTETQSPSTVRPAAGALVDTHCHLTLERLGADPDGYWQRARDAGVEKAIVIGIDAQTSREVVDFVRGHEGLFASVGIHPNEASHACDGDLDVLRGLAADPKVVALGESGLDTYWDRSSTEDQERWLGLHVDLALELELPLVLHIRDAYGRAAELLEPAQRRGLRGVIHCFAGEGEEVEPFVGWGWPISFSGILTYGKASNVRDGARRTPLEQCLIETDSPWLAPTGAGTKLNEPAFVTLVARRLAEVKGVSEEEIAAITTANARRVFALGGS